MKKCKERQVRIIQDIVITISGVSSLCNVSEAQVRIPGTE